MIKMQREIIYRKQPYTLHVFKDNEVSYIFKVQPDIVCTVNQQKLKEAINSHIEALKSLLEVLQDD